MRIWVKDMPRVYVLALVTEWLIVPLYKRLKESTAL